MSLEEEIEKSASGKDSESFNVSLMPPKIAYTRDFLLSLSELDVCKELPNGFDSSLLSEFEDGYHGTQDRLRNPSSLPLQSHRRTEFSSSPPTRGDSSNYSRGVYGRWDNRPSVRSDRDSESQSEKDSDSGRPYGNQSRRPWQTSEHDGLLGSGSFARPPGYAAAGLSGPKGRSGDQYQLKKSNEPYQPPRPYKAGPLSRKEITDSVNDETFGSLECASQDRAEEERRRRESFELMRKEQHKSLQEKQKLTTDKLKKDHTTDVTEMFGEGEVGNRAFSIITEEDESVTKFVPTNELSKPSLQASGVRPLVPPGFRSTVVEKNSSTTSLAQSRSLEAERPDTEESSVLAKAIKQNGTLDTQEGRLLVQKMGLGERQLTDASVDTTFEKRNEHIQNFSSDFEILNGKQSADNKLYMTSHPSKDFETQGVGESVKGFKGTGNNLIDPSRQAQPSSILDKLFDSVTTDNLIGSSGLLKKQDIKQEDPWAPPNVKKSSKFAQWFLEEEEKEAGDLTHARPNDLLSLIGSGEKVGSQASDVKPPQHIPSDFPFPSSEITDGHPISNIIPSTTGIPKRFYKSSKEETASPILTCEDLEQTILSGFSKSSSTSQKARQEQNVCGPEPKTETDNHASQHLLSLLQKGPVLKDKMVSSVAEIGSTEEVENVSHSGKTSTLETLFGSAFMKELQSAEAPVSSQRGLDSSAFTSSMNGPVGIGGGQRQQSMSGNFGSWLGINDTQIEPDSSKLRTDVMPKRGGFDGATDIQFPEEESLIAAGGEPLNTRNTLFSPFGNLIDGESQSRSSNRPLDISDKLAALGSGFKDLGPSMRGPHGSLDREFPFHNQMNHERPFFHPLDSHPTQASPPMNFNAPDGMIQRGAPNNHQFPSNMMRPPLRQLSGGQPGFDPHHPMLQQRQMQRPMVNNIPHHLQEFNRGAPVPLHLRTRAGGQMQEHNPMQGFPFDQHQANFRGSGMAMQAPQVRGNHPEALQQLLEMELRANSSKRMHPFAPLGNNQGVHGHDLDSSFRYR